MAVDIIYAVGVAYRILLAAIRIAYAIHIQPVVFQIMVGVSAIWIADSFGSPAVWIAYVLDHTARIAGTIACLAISPLGDHHAVAA